MKTRPDKNGTVWEVDEQGNPIRPVGVQQGGGQPNTLITKRANPVASKSAELDNVIKSLTVQGKQRDLAQPIEDPNAPKLPTGYRWKADGTAELIPGVKGSETTKPGKPMRQGDADKLAGQVDTLALMKDAASTFRDDYAGNAFTGEAENWAQGLFNTGTPGQREWWANFRRFDNLDRNELFGASLTDGEKAAYAQTTVSPNMTPREVRANAEMRLSIIEKALARRVGRLRTVYNNEEIDASLGEFADSFSPDKGREALRERLGIQIDPAMLSQTPGGGDQSLGQVKGPLYGDINQPLGGPSDAQVILGDAFEQGAFNQKKTETQAGATDKPFVTAQDQVIADRLSKLWRGGASYDRLMQEYDAINKEYKLDGTYKPSVSGLTLKQQATLPGRKRPGFNPVATGRKSDLQNAKDALLDTDLGAGALSYFDSAGLGLSDEIAGVMGGDEAQQKAQFAKDYLSENRPGASFAGNVAGSLTGILGGQALVKAGARTARNMAGNQTGRRMAARLGGTDARALTTANVAYGAGYGAGSDNENRLRGAAIGGGVGFLGDKVGGKLVDALGRGISGVSNTAVQNLTEQGIPLSLGQTLGNRGILGRAAQKLESIPTIGDMTFGNKAQGLTDYNVAEMRRVADIVGAPAPKQAGDVGMEYLQSVGDKAYTDALSGLQITPDQQFTSQFGQAMTQGRSIPTKGEEFGAVVDRSIAPLFDQNNGALTGDALQQALQTLRSNRGSFGKEGAMGNMAAEQFGTMDDALTGLMQRQAPDRFPMYQKANEFYSNLVPIQDAMIGVNRTNNADSIFTPRQLQAAITNNTIKYGGKGAAARGQNIPQLTRDAVQILPQTVPDSGTVGRGLMSMALPTALGGTAYGVQDISPTAAATLATLAALSTKTGAKIAQSALVKRGPKTKMFGSRVRGLAKRGQLLGAPLALPLVE